MSILRRWRAVAREEAAWKELAAMLGWMLMFGVAGGALAVVIVALVRLEWSAAIFIGALGGGGGGLLGEAIFYRRLRSKFR